MHASLLGQSCAYNWIGLELYSVHAVVSMHESWFLQLDHLRRWHPAMIEEALCQLLLLLTKSSC